MSGGGNRKASGGMSAKATSSEDPDVIREKMEALIPRVEDVGRMLDESRAQKEAAEQELLSVQRHVQQLEQLVETSAMDLTAYREQVDDLEAQLAKMDTSDASALSAAEEKELASLTKDIKKKSAALEKQKDTVQPLRNEIAAIHDELAKVGGIRVKVQKSKVESLSSQIDDLRRGPGDHLSPLPGVLSLVRVRDFRLIPVADR
mmetsp:Transcript_33478/g.93972  ORF Transcript_33478/g.93972 Transcript_33478/m.93972 type:complete len:204 (-) Transcript_33478:1387-1998(-)